MGECEYAFTKNKFIEKQTASGIKDSSSRNIEKSYWQEIIDNLNRIKLDSLPDYKAPTNLREMDGDWYSYIMITTKKQTYQTPYYDTSTPNGSLYELDSICGH